MGGGAASAASENGPTPDAALMARALDEARAGAELGEVPVGAVIADPTGQVIAAAHNRTLTDCDPTAHAEIVALRAAAKVLGNHRLNGCTMVVTLEPCPMCAGAISHARIGRLVYGASDPKGGGVAHGPRVFDQPTCHFRPEVIGGLKAETAGDLLRRFFRARR